MPLSGAARPSRSEFEHGAGVAAGFEPLDDIADRAYCLDQAPEGAEQAEEDQKSGHVARDIARLVEAGGDRIQNAAHQLRRHRHAADAAAEDRRHRRQQHRGAVDREAGIGEAEIIDPGDFRIKPQHLAQRENDADDQHADDQRVQAGIGHERRFDLLVQHEGDQSAQHDEHQHPQQEDAGRRQFERIEFFCHADEPTPGPDLPRNMAQTGTKEKAVVPEHQHKSAE